MANFLRAAAKLDCDLDMFRAALLPTELTPLDGEVTWCRGDTVAVLRAPFDPGEFIRLRGGALEPKPPGTENELL